MDMMGKVTMLHTYILTDGERAYDRRQMTPDQHHAARRQAAAEWRGERVWIRDGEEATGDGDTETDKRGHAGDGTAGEGKAEGIQRRGA